MIRSGRTWGRLRHDLTGTPEYSQSTNVRGTIGVSLSSVFLVCCSFVIAFAFSACTATRPVVKIGLLAPFEGLHRERGYEALAAMRAALAEQPLSDVEVLPLALDTSADPSQARRAAAKLLRDESVVAVVGPLRPQQVAAVADLIAAADVIWRLPTAPSSAEKLQMLVTAFLTQIDGKNILLAGQNSGWPQLSADEWSARSGKDVTIGDEVETDASVDAILWLGDAPTGQKIVPFPSGQRASAVIRSLRLCCPRSWMARRLAPCIGESRWTAASVQVSSGSGLQRMNPPHRLRMPSFGPRKRRWSKWGETKRDPTRRHWRYSLSNAQEAVNWPKSSLSLESRRVRTAI